MDNNPNSLENQNPNQVTAGIIQKWQIPNGLITPLALAATPTTAKGDTYYVDANGIFARLPIAAKGSIYTVTNGIPAFITPGSANQILTMSGGVPTWQAAPSSLATSRTAYTETVDNSTFTTSYVTISHVTFTLTNNSNVFITGTVDLRSSAGGDVAQINLFDGAGALTTNGALTPIGDVTGQRYAVSVVYTGALTAGAHTINLKGVNSSSSATVTVGDTQLAVMAIPG